ADIVGGDGVRLERGGLLERRERHGPLGLLHVLGALGEELACLLDAGVGVAVGARGRRPGEREGERDERGMAERAARSGHGHLGDAQKGLPPKTPPGSAVGAAAVAADAVCAGAPGAALGPGLGLEEVACGVFAVALALGAAVEEGSASAPTA